MNSDAVVPFLGGILATAAGAYIAFYLKGASARRDQIAQALASFYSGTAVAYYAAREVFGSENETDSEPYIEIHKRFDERYENFLAASTTLASLVPPTLRDEVLSIEDFWDQLNEKRFTRGTAKELFDRLDNIREKILDSIQYSRFTDPFWKSRISLLKRSLLGFAILLGLLFAAYWFSCRLSGDVFLLSDGGKVEIAPGALITIFPQTSEQSVDKFIASTVVATAHEEFANRVIQGTKNSPIEIAKVQNQAA